MKYLTLVLALMAAAGCGLTEATDRICTLEARPGIVVRVFEASAQDTVRIDEGIVFARTTGFEDSTRVVDGMASLAHERPGLYSVEVESPGYEAWRQEDVLVLPGECHVQTVTLDADLTRVDGSEDVR